VVCRGAERAQHQRLPEGAQRLCESGPSRLFTCSLPCIAKNKCRQSSKGLHCFEKRHPGGSVFSFASSAPSRSSVLGLSIQRGWDCWGFFIPPAFCFVFNPLGALCNLARDRKSQRLGNGMRDRAI